MCCFCPVSHGEHDELSVKQGCGRDRVPKSVSCFLVLGGKRQTGKVEGMERLTKQKQTSKKQNKTKNPQQNKTNKNQENKTPTTKQTNKQTTRKTKASLFSIAWPFRGSPALLTLLLFPSGKACPQQGGCCPYRVSGHLTLSGPSRGRTQGAFSAILKSSYVAAGARALKPRPPLPTGARKEERDSLGCHSQDCGEQITLFPLKGDFGDREARLDQIKDTVCIIYASHASTGLLGRLGPRTPTLRDLENGFTAAEKWRR